MFETPPLWPKPIPVPCPSSGPGRSSSEPTAPSSGAAWTTPPACTGSPSRPTRPPRPTPISAGPTPIAGSTTRPFATASWPSISIPDSGNAHNDLGAYLIELGRWDESEAWLESAARARRYGSYHLPYYNLGRLYEHRFEFARAEVAYRRSTQLSPEFKPARRALGLLAARRN
jgi:hypothetical protein